MSFPTRSLSTRLPGAGSQGTSSTGPSPMLVARIAEKKAELEHLKELRDLSAAVAGQMEALEQKLSTLSDGTEAIAMVIGNWHNVLRAINMASAKLSKPPGDEPTDPEDQNLALPQTLVRIPTEHAPTLQAQAENATDGGVENASTIS
ncbi:DASH complex subunit DAD2 [Colletotrichum plurivorum]|uniref:DASH complex subunit DAD2 n=1 Tax=Colletotrichum plurivorum TaxID=2175906 RepID=A0A8H6N9I7_9PEZI|nr:DASH complex subunit DAD2 [Colletotrichum plurivorum]